MANRGKEFYELVCKDRFTSIEDRITAIENKVDAKLTSIESKLDKKIEPLISFRFKTIGMVSLLVVILPLAVSITTTVYINKDGKLVRKVEGSMSKSRLEKYLKELING